MNLYGANGHCKVIIDILKKKNIPINSIFDDNKAVHSIFEFPVERFRDEICQGEFIISIGNNVSRKKIAEKLKGMKFATAIHPSAIISSNVTIDVGSVVMGKALINAAASIGKHCIINTASIVEHDCKINNFVHISPGAILAGLVTVGEGAHIGIGAKIIPQIKIGAWSVIGAGAVVVKDVPDYAVVVGNPAKILKFTNQ